MTLAIANPATKLERQLREARLDAFVGRAGHLAVLAAALEDGVQSFTVLYLHGPGGIGKSTLLQRFADAAHQAGREVACVDVAAEAVPEAGAPPTAERARPLVLIDDLDRREDAQQWLLGTVLPAFPSGALVVVAARRPPAVAWQADPGWNDLLTTLAVDPLPRAEADALLDTHRVAPERRPHVHALCDGNPLALRVTAQILSADPGPDEAVDLAVAHAIFDRVVGELPTPAHRQALEVCAHALDTTEELLRAAAPGLDAGVLFEWLRRRPFMRSEAHGIFPDGVVRNVVEIESRWRDGAQFESMHVRARDYLRERARSMSAEAVLPVLANLLFAERRTATAAPAFGRTAAGRVEERGYRPGDRAQVLRMAADAEGAESARLVEFWLDRRPEAFTVYRRPATEELSAFLCRLRLDEPSAEELATDPVVAAAWSHGEAATPPGPGEGMTVARFCVEPESYHRPSPALELMQLRCAATVVRDDSPAWSVVVTPDPGAWSALLERFPAGDGGWIRVGGRDYALLRHSWPAPERQAMARRRRTPAFASRAEFDLAVRQAFRSWRRPDLLADNGLIRSRIVGERGGPDGITDLRDVLSAALETLGSDPRQAKLHRALVTTYLRGAPTQDAAAERLSLPFSTYRRHLSRGLETICDLLWKAEVEGIDFTDHGHTGTPRGQAASGV